MSLKCENKDEILVTENVSNNAEACHEKPKKWEETYKVDFVNNVDVDSIQNLEIQLENLNIENVVQSDIDTLVGKLGEIFISSAKETIGECTSENSLLNSQILKFTICFKKSTDEIT
jgi:hypothetical protein